MDYVVTLKIAKPFYSQPKPTKLTYLIALMRSKPTIQLSNYPPEILPSMILGNT